MAIKLTVFSSERIITGECQKVQTLKPDGKPDFGSAGTNSGHEWEERRGLEVDLDPSVLGDPIALHAAITNYETIVNDAVQAALVRKGANRQANGHQAVAAPTVAAPTKTRGTWGGTELPPAQSVPATKKQAPAKTEPEPEDESQEEASEEPARKTDDQGPPPKNGSQFFAWAAKHHEQGKALVYAAWASLKYEGKIMTASEDKLLKAWKKAQKMLAEGWDK